MIAVVGLSLGALVITSSPASAHNPTTMGYFSCAATRTSPMVGNEPVTHSHAFEIGPGWVHYHCYFDGVTYDCAWDTYAIDDGHGGFTVFGPDWGPFCTS